MNDDPFGVSKRRDQTIVRPNPGGRRVAGPAGPDDRGPHDPLAPPSSQPRTPADPWTTGGAPDPHAATPAGYEFGQPTAPDLRRPPPQAFAPPQPNPATEASAAPPAQSLIADAPDISQIRVANKNPIVRAATPLLLLLGRLRLTMSNAQFAALMGDVATAIGRFEKELRASGVTDDQIQTAKYALCATADDIVQNLPGSGRHQWTQYSMLTQFFGQTTGGVEFFERLARAKQDPAVNYGVLEVMHACLSLGFHGKYRAIQGGGTLLERERRDLHELLRRVRPRPGDDLSPHWKGLALAARRAAFSLPVWTVAAVAGAVLLGGYITLRLLLANGGEVAATRLATLYPTGQILLARAGYQPAPPPPPPLPPDPPIDRLRDQIGGLDGVELQQNGQTLMIRMRAQFDVAAATVRPEFKTLIEQVSQALVGEPGDILVIGHTDSDPIRNNPRFPSNWHLSVARAEAVAEIMKGILERPERIQIEGKGADEPIAPNTTREGKAKNRRVEVFLRQPSG